MSDTSAATQPRIVPGAPPPMQLSKSQKKKRKAAAEKKKDEPPAQQTIPDTTAAALVEKAPAPAEVKEGVVAPALVAQPSVDEALAEDSFKLSPIIKIIDKRLKATTKKLVRDACFACRVLMFIDVVWCTDSYPNLQGDRAVEAERGPETIARIFASLGGRAEGAWRSKEGC